MTESSRSKPAISLIIPTLDREDSLCSTIDHFLTQKHQLLDLIVIDQTTAHCGDTVRFLAGVTNRIHYVPVKYKSLTRARNHGVSIAKGDVVLFVDDDIVPSRGFVAAHASAYLDS